MVVYEWHWQRKERASDRLRDYKPCSILLPLAEGMALKNGDHATRSTIGNRNLVDNVFKPFDEIKIVLESSTRICVEDPEP